MPNDEFRFTISGDYDAITKKCSKFLKNGSLTTSDEERRKRKRKGTIRYGYDEVSSDTEKEEEQPPLKRRFQLNRMNAMTNCEFPVPPPINFERVLEQTSSIEYESTLETTTKVGLPSPPENNLVEETGQASNSSTANEAEMESVDFDMLNSSFASSIGTIVSDKCHCQHQMHWAREILKIVIRLEERLERCRCGPHLQEAEEEASHITFPTSTEDVIGFFKEIASDESKRSDALKCVSKEVTKKRKKSIYRILLRIAPPKAWCAFSKNGQRGKHSATEIGLPAFIKDCLELKKVSMRKTWTGPNRC